jgi:hypothetical protein
LSTTVLSLETPPGFVVREEAHKAAYENGYRIDLGTSEGWLRYRSSTARGDIWIARAARQGSWLLSIAHAGVAAELDMPAVDGITGPGFVTYAFASLRQLYQTLERVYKLGINLPDVPLETFKKATAHLPRTTEAERLTVERLGQSIFRQALLEYWNGRCPLTGITDPALLRASHIIPWSECESDELRLDVHNGLLLSGPLGRGLRRRPDQLRRRRHRPPLPQAHRRSRRSPRARFGRPTHPINRTPPPEPRPSSSTPRIRPRMSER